MSRRFGRCFPGGGRGPLLSPGEPAGDSTGELVGAHEQWRVAASGLLEHGAAGREHVLGLEAVEEHHFLALPAAQLDLLPHGRTASAETSNVHDSAGQVGLPGQMPEQIRFVHGGDRMLRHGGMAIEPVNLLAPRGGKEIAEDHEPPELRRRGQEGGIAVGELLQGDLDGPADVADLDGGVEGRAHLVQEGCRPAVSHQAEDRRQQPLEGRGGLRSGCPGQADGPDPGKPSPDRSQHLGSGDHESGNPVAREDLRSRHGAREVIAVEHVQQGRIRDHQRSIPHLSMAAANSAWSASSRLFPASSWEIPCLNALAPPAAPKGCP